MTFLFVSLCTLYTGALLENRLRSPLPPSSAARLCLFRCCLGMSFTWRAWIVRREGRCHFTYYLPGSKERCMPLKINLFYVAFLLHAAFLQRFPFTMENMWIRGSEVSPNSDRNDCAYGIHNRSYNLPLTVSLTVSQTAVLGLRQFEASQNGTRHPSASPHRGFQPPSLFVVCSCCVCFMIYPRGKGSTACLGARPLNVGAKVKTTSEQGQVLYIQYHPRSPIALQE